VQIVGQLKAYLAPPGGFYIFFLQKEKGMANTQIWRQALVLLYDRDILPKKRNRG